MNKNYFEVKNVDFSAGGKTKVKNVSFSIKDKGDIICLLGPSGIGKTTILRTIAGLEKINNGSIKLNNRLISSKTKYTEHKISFSESSMYIFTDGITEIKNPKGEMLGSEGFQNYIKKHQSKSTNDRLRIIVNEILNEGHIQKDDLTIVVLDGK